MIVVNTRFLSQKLTGVQRYAIELCKWLKKIYAEDIMFVCPSCIVHEEIASELDAKVIGTHIGHLWEQWDLPKYLREHGSPLLVNLSNTAPVFYRNKVTTIHDITYVRYPKTFSKSFVLFYRLLIPLVIRTSKHIFTVSEFSKNEISSFYHTKANKLSVIYNATSNVFKPVLDKKLSKKKYFMAVSSIKENKNFIYILEAFRRFSAKNKQVELFVIGDLKSKSFKRIDVSKYTENRQIKFLGRINDTDLVAYYSNAVAFIFPSLYEGFGIPPLEAQACGCPAICSKASCLPEVFQDSVLYCNPYSVDSLVEAMNSILDDEDLCNQLIGSGYQNVARYSWEKSAKDMAKVLDNLQGNGLAK